MTYDDLPEIPDDPAGVTYLNDNFTDADGWSPIRCTLSYSNGKMIVTATDANPYISRSITGLNDKHIRVEFKKISGAATNSRVLVIIGGNPEPAIYVDYDTNEQINDVNTGDLGGSPSSINLYPGYTGSAAGDVYEISFIYIGTGEYLPRKDATGNYDIQVVGSVPVPGISGNGIRRDGVCAYEKTSDAVLMPDVFTFSQWIDGEEKSVFQWFFDTRNDVELDGRFAISRRYDSDALSIAYSDGVAYLTLDISDYFTSGNFLMGVNVEWDSSGTGLDVTVYKNGVLFGTYSAPTALKPDANVLRFGRHKAVGYYAAGTFDELRIWSRALSAEEHYNLARSKSRGPVTHIYANALNRGTAPSGASDPGYEGETRITDTHLYIYTNGAWRRFAVTGW